jgi:hypothetical protein
MQSGGAHESTHADRRVLRTTKTPAQCRPADAAHDAGRDERVRNRLAYGSILISNEVKPLQRICCAVNSKKHASRKIEEKVSMARSIILRNETPVIISGELKE